MDEISLLASIQDSDVRTDLAIRLGKWMARKDWQAIETLELAIEETCEDAGDVESSRLLSTLLKVCRAYKAAVVDLDRQVAKVLLPVDDGDRLLPESKADQKALVGVYAGISTPKGLADFLDVKPSFVSRVIRRLERAELVREQKRRGSDGRKHHYVSTPEGSKVAPALLNGHRFNLAEYLELMRAFYATAYSVRLISAHGQDRIIERYRRDLLEMAGAAVCRGASVERVFLVQGDQEPDNLAEWTNIGVKCHVADAAYVQEHSRPFLDFGIFTTQSKIFVATNERPRDDRPSLVEIRLDASAIHEWSNCFAIALDRAEAREAAATGRARTLANRRSPAQVFQ